MPLSKEGKRLASEARALKNDAKRAQAEREIDAVDQALRDGFPLHGDTNANVKSAVRVAAERLEILPQTLRDRLLRYKLQFGFQPNAALFDPSKMVPQSGVIGHAGPKLGGTIEDRRLIEAQDENRRLQKALRDAHRASIDADKILSLLGVVADFTPEPPNWLITPAAKRTGKATSEVPVSTWADWHVGETVEADETNGGNEYNVSIAEDRVKRLVKKTVDLAINHHPSGKYPGFVLNLAGDFVSGALHPELLKTDELSPLESVKTCIDWLIEGIKTLADEFGAVYVAAVCGNHGRTTKKPEFKKYVFWNLDWIIYKMVQKFVADDKRIVFDIRPSNDVHYRVYGVRYLLVHGDMLGVKGGDGIIGHIGPIMRGEMKKGRQSNTLKLPYDKMLCGHWHPECNLWLPRAIVASSVKGFDEYARLALGANPGRPQQPLWFVHPRHGMTAHWDIYVDAPQVSTEQADWVSIFNRG